MMTPIEAMAAAIFRAMFPPNEEEWRVAEKWREWDQERTRCLAQALAALRALRENVSERMLYDTWKAGRPSFLAVETTRAMITAALRAAEEEETGRE